MTPHDPNGRPVERREDAHLLSLHRCKVCGTAWLLWPDAIHGGGWNLLDKYQRPGACCDNAAMGEQIEHLRDIPLAASPVPCAAPPADSRFAELLADLRTVESIYDKDRVAHFYASAIEKIVDKWLHNDEPEARATRPPAEGERDEPEMETVSNGDVSDHAGADGVLRVGNVGRERDGLDRGTGLPTPDALLLAVSRDPHRLTFAAFSEANRTRCEDPQGFSHALSSWSTSDWFVAIMGELGEAANIVKKLNRYRDGVRGNKESEAALRAKLRSELADSFIYLDLIFQACGFDASEAVIDTFDAKSAEIGYHARLRGEAAVRPETCGAIYPHGLMRACAKPVGHHGMHQDSAAHCWLDDPAAVRVEE